MPRAGSAYHFVLSVREALRAETFAVRPKVLEGEERETFFQKMSAIFPLFLEYQQKAHPRLIPMVELIRSSALGS